MVKREVATNASGRAAFDDLPDGRYEVDAVRTGLLSLGPRIIDLAGPAGKSLDFALKPVAVVAAGMACGGFDPSTLQTLAATADLVLHVKIVGQKTTDGSTPFSTTNSARVMQVFKARMSLPSVGGSMIAVVQGGGRIDRGDAIDAHFFNQLPPLNVGDEYVLLLVRGTDGVLYIQGAEEGTFVIRNDRVQSLGSAGASAKWKDAPADKFFHALVFDGRK